MSIDMEQLLPSFIEESLENLDQMEACLLNIDTEAIDLEKINEIFRLAHTIKGNSAILNFTAIWNLAHSLESLLDKVRSNRFILEKSHINLLLNVSDCIRKMLLEIKRNKTADESLAKELNANLNQLFQVRENLLGWKIIFKPKPDALKLNNNPNQIIARLKELGKLETKLNTDNLPKLSLLLPTQCYLRWELILYANLSKKDLLEIMIWGADEEGIVCTPLQTFSEDNSFKHSAPKEKRTVENTIIKPNLTSIRIEANKIDNLMNSVGELVIIESALKQNIKDIDPKKLPELYTNLDELQRNSRQLQERVLRIRMVPVAFAINRFPRMVADISSKLGKELQLVIQGEQTEIDKSMIEKITDPLMHIIRNAIDHGIEAPEVREKLGKPRTGIIKLNAYEEGGNIMIEVTDDGGGINIEKIQTSAIAKGILAKGQSLTKEECYQLIFQPGFSTSETVTDISGRGVGLDVVARNIHELGGSIEIKSNPSKGTTFKLQFPLTLAIIDGQLLKVGKQTFVIPLINIVEMVQLEPKLIHEQKNKTYYTAHEKKIPIISIAKALSVKSEGEEKESKQNFLIIVNINNQSAALQCDELLDQQQIVIKNIAENYCKVPGIAGATVLGDGGIALILDAKELLDIENNFLVLANIDTKSNSSDNLKSENEVAQGGEYLCFLLENKEYAFKIKSIREICNWRTPTQLPFSPPFVMGIINLRGLIIPIIDLRKIFLVSSREYSTENSIIVLIIKINENLLKHVGVIVDSITGTRRIDEGEIMDVPKIDYLLLKRYTQGFFFIKEKLITLLSIQNLIQFDDKMEELK